FHFMEVKHLLYLNNGVMASYALIGFCSLHKLNVSHNLWRLFWPFKQVIWLPMIVVIFLVFNFNTIFIAFHYIAFSNVSMLFHDEAALYHPVTDTIILVLDGSLFLLCFVYVCLSLQLAIQWGYRIGKSTLIGKPQ